MISFIDFYTNQCTAYHDSMYYNSVQLNYQGADIFTNILRDSLILRKILN